MPRPTTRERRSDSRVGVEEGQCPIQGWIASRFERGRSPIARRFNWDKKVIDRGLRWFLLDNELSTCSIWSKCTLLYVSYMLVHISFFISSTYI